MRFAILGLASFAAMAGTASAGIVQNDNGSSSGSMMGPAYGVQGGSYDNRGSGIVYESSSQTASRANGGAAGFTGASTPADAARTLFDDVPISNAILNSATNLEVCKVTVGIRRIGSVTAPAPATDVNIYWSTLAGAATAPDTILDTPPNLLGTVALGADTVTSTTLVSIGTSGGPTLFSVPLQYGFSAGFGAFSIGVSFSNTSTANGWRITNPSPSPNATGLAFLWDPNMTGTPNPEFAFSFGTTLPSTFFIIVEGTPVPAPGSLALVGLGGLVALRRRR